MNGAHSSVAVALAGKIPWACRPGVSFFSSSVLLPGASVEFLESFLTHLMGLRECKLGVLLAASDAPTPAGPCAAAFSAPTVREIETPKSRTAPTKSVFFIGAPSLKIPGEKRCRTWLHTQ